MQQLTHINGAPVVDNTNTQTAGPRGPALLQDIWLLEKLAHFDREVIPERRMHAKGSGAFGHFTVTDDITRHTKAKLIVYPGASHGLADTHKDKLNADLLAFTKGIGA